MTHYFEEGNIKGLRYYLTTERLLYSFAVKNNAIQTHTGTFSRQGDLYALGRIRITISKEFYQASWGMGEFYCCPLDI
ncbi:hypothetical protein ES702_04523 [subsurface metagenome]